MLALAEYIWMDGGSEDSTVQKLRSKTRVIIGPPPVGGRGPSHSTIKLDAFPIWNFDGSSTLQSGGESSDLTLKPVRFVNDPLRGEGNYLVMCEVMNNNGTPHLSNTRARLNAVLTEMGTEKYDPWFGFEQEYTLYNTETERPLGWPSKGLPARVQGPYYCGVGADEVSGRELVEAHLRACLDAGIMIYGINAEVMLGQWEYQIGHRGFAGETADPLTVADHLWLSRYLLYRIGESFGIAATLSCKPEKGDWNGAGAHTNFSTADMRDKETGADAIELAIEKLSHKHKAHIKAYGEGLEKRLTGKHETCGINEFKSGAADRGASIRIPAHVAEQGYGYIEDRRPGANCDPYMVCERILRTVCVSKATPALV